MRMREPLASTFNDCELRFFSELAIIRTQCIDYAGVGNTQHAQIAIFKFAIYLKKSETQLFYYAIKTRPTVLIISAHNNYGAASIQEPCLYHI